jgi:hypothetical protein
MMVQFAASIVQKKRVEQSSRPSVGTVMKTKSRQMQRNRELCMAQQYLPYSALAAEKFIRRPILKIKTGINARFV